MSIAFPSLNIGSLTNNSVVGGSREAFLRSLASTPESTRGALDNSSLHFLLGEGINTFLVDRPSTRDLVIQSLIEPILDLGRVIYVDLDTSFRAINRINGKDHQNLIFIITKGDDVEDALVSLLSWTDPNLKLLVMDSVTMFSHIVSTTSDFVSKNRRLGYYLALMREFVSRIGVPMVITSHLGYRRVNGNDWTKKYSGGRILEYHSSSIFNALVSDDSLSIKVMKSDDQMLIGRVFLVQTNIP